jgi:hypothetical protein
MKTYDHAPARIRERVDALIARYHPDLSGFSVRVDVLVVVSDKPGPALKHHGYDALATIRVLPVKDRAAGRGDAEMLIDLGRYDKELNEGERDALLDHELYHLKVIKEGPIAKRDSADRPKLKCRLHDRQLGWFDEIARRHGDNSLERRGARHLFDAAGQDYFPFAAEVTARRVSA